MKRLVLAAALLLAACTSEKTAMTARPPQWTQANAPPSALGASVRAKIASSGTGKLAAAETGNYMDSQEAELRQRLRGVSVRRVGDDIVLDVSNDNLFATRSANLSSGANGLVAAMADVLMRYNKTFVNVGGYSDTSGSADFNLKLSQSRAQAVAGLLVRRGVDQSRVTAQGFGETHLKIPTGDNVNEPRNRRVEIRITPHVA